MKASELEQLRYIVDKAAEKLHEHLNAAEGAADADVAARCVAAAFVGVGTGLQACAAKIVGEHEAAAELQAEMWTAARLLGELKVVRDAVVE